MATLNEYYQQKEMLDDTIRKWDENKHRLVGFPLYSVEKIWAEVFAFLLGFGWLYNLFPKTGKTISLPILTYNCGWKRSKNDELPEMPNLFFMPHNVLNYSYFSRGKREYHLTWYNWPVVIINYLAFNIGQFASWGIISFFTVPAFLIIKIKTISAIKQWTINNSIYKMLNSFEPKDLAKNWLLEKVDKNNVNLPASELIKHVNFSQFLEGLKLFLQEKKINNQKDFEKLGKKEKGNITNKINIYLKESKSANTAEQTLNKIFEPINYIPPKITQTTKKEEGEKENQKEISAFQKKIDQSGFKKK